MPRLLMPCTTLADRTLVAVFTWRSDGPVLVRQGLVHNSFLRVLDLLQTRLR